MRIGIDLINLNLTNLGGGLGRYAMQLIDGLATMDKKNEYVLFINTSIANQINISNSKFISQTINVPHRRYAPWNQIYFASHIKQLRSIDLLHSPVTPSPLLLFGATKTIATLHDLAWKFFPETFKKIGVLWWSFAWPLSLKQSAHVVVDSESTKRDIVKFFHTPQEKISVIYPYISFHLPPDFTKMLDVVKKKHNLPEKYILSVGVSHKRKNLGVLIRAFQILKEEKKIPHKLVLTGPKDWGTKTFIGEISKLGLQKEIIFTGSVADADLSLIYRAADVFVFPSLYEGFGYPILEAMDCGAPVVVANNSSLPEVAGDAGLYIDSLNPKDIADKIFQVISSPVLAEKLKNLGFEQAKKFTMENMIKKYIEVYERYGKK